MVKGNAAMPSVVWMDEQYRGGDDERAGGSEQLSWWRSCALIPPLVDQPGGGINLLWAAPRPFQGVSSLTPDPGCKGSGPPAFPSPYSAHPDIKNN